MPIIEIKIPQLGEGLQEARLVRFLKQPGETVSPDEPIFEMETDKAVMEIESPAAGRLEAWTAQEEDVLPIGAVIGRIETGEVASRESRVESRETKEPGDDPTPGTQPSLTTHDSRLMTHDSPDVRRNVAVPPRTRAYAKEKGLSEEELARLAQAAGGRLMPEAIDRYLEESQDASRKSQEGGGEEGVASRKSQVASEDTQTPALSHDSRLTTHDSTLPPPAFQDSPLPPRQRTLIYHLRRSAQAVISATMEMPVGWGAVEAVRAQFKQRAGRENGGLPTQFLLFAWCLAQAAKEHPRFRAVLLNDTTLRQYERLHLGIAVARPDDELLMARVPDADALPFDAFIAAAHQAIRRARDGEDQTSDAMQVSVTNLAAAGVRLGIPVVVAPAAATLFLGEPFDEAFPLPQGGIGFRRTANMVLSFDHRFINGIGAARFLAAIRRRVENQREEFPSIALTIGDYF